MTEHSPTEEMRAVRRPTWSAHRFVALIGAAFGGWFGRDVLAPFVGSRAMLILVAWLALHLIPASPTDHWEVSRDGNIVNFSGRGPSAERPFVNMWSRWDAGWYYKIAKNGYSFVPGEYSNTAFFPVYPMLMRGLHSLFPFQSDASWFICGITVSNAALIVGLCYVFRLVRMEFDEATARRTVLYLLCFPTTLFLSAVYTESVFLAVSVAALYYARQGKWWLSGAFAGAAVLTRAPGIVLLAPLGVEYLMQRGFNLRKIRPDVLSLALVPLALAGLFGFMYWQFGNAQATRDAQLVWSGRSAGIVWYWDTIADFLRGPIRVHGGPRSIVDLIFTSVFAVLVITATVRLRPMYGIYAIAAFLFTTAWGSFSGMSRYSLAIFPAFIVLGRAGTSDLFHPIYLAISTGFAAFFMVLFVHWRWVG